jgi:hypothetical protein
MLAAVAGEATAQPQAGQAPADQTPADQTPADQTPADQTQSGKAPNPVAPNLKRQPAPLPPGWRAQKQSPAEEAPSAADEARPPSHRCPDPGRRLELIV